MQDYKKERDSTTSDIKEDRFGRSLTEAKAEIGGLSSSLAILTKNRRNTNGSGNPPNVFPLSAVLIKQGMRTDRVLDLFHSQAKTLEHYGASLLKQHGTLEVQGELLKKHSDALVHIFKDHQKLRDDVDQVEKKVETHGSILKQHEAKLEVIQGHVDKLTKGHRDIGNLRGNTNLRRSSRLEASNTQQAPAKASKVKPDRSQCGYCGKLLGSYYLCKHMLRCPVFRQGQQDESQ